MYPIGPGLGCHNPYSAYGCGPYSNFNVLTYPDLGPHGRQMLANAPWGHVTPEMWAHVNGCAATYPCQRAAGMAAAQQYCYNPAEHSQMLQGGWDMCNNETDRK